MFISLKRFMDSRPEQLAEALLRMARLLVQGIELHAVKGDAADYDKFRADMRQVQETLVERPAPSEVLVMAGAVVKTMEEYNSRTFKFLHAQSTELQTVVAMLTKTMTALAVGSEASVMRLQAVERQLHKASMIEDFQTARLRLSECLEGVRTEIVLQKEEAARTVSEMKSELARSQERVASSAPGSQGPRAQDAVTGLPQRPDAEAALLEAARQNRRAYAVIFSIERLELINSRFGYAAGDQVMVLFSQHLAQNLSRSDQLFRWSGPAVLALLERDGTLKQVREEVARITAQRLEKTVTVGTRSVLLPVCASWTIFPVAEVRPVQLLFHQLDQFVQGGAGRQMAETA
jgi:GGDEF domain-containing protein